VTADEGSWLFCSQFAVVLTRPQVRIDLSHLADDLFGVLPPALLSTRLPA